MLKNTANDYGLIAILLHWLVAAAIFGLFGLGLWMTGLEYYDPWYQRAPEVHKGFGVLLFVVAVLRLAWRLRNPVPRAEATHSRLERRLARFAHGLLYLLPFAVMIAGYLISTADGRSIEVFGWFEVPAALSGLDEQEDIAGLVHEALAFTLIGLVALHALAALKHHFIDRDRTLRRMLGGKH